VSPIRSAWSRKRSPNSTSPQSPRARPATDGGACQVYAGAFFEAARQHGKLDELREQLAQFADALSENRQLAVFFFSPYLSTSEKQEGLARVLEGPDPLLLNFLELLIEKHRMPVIFRIRQRYERLWEEERRTLPVEVTSAIALDEQTTRTSARRSASAPGAP